jgi:hypothetical protein
LFVLNILPTILKLIPHVSTLVKRKIRNCIVNKPNAPVYGFGDSGVILKCGLIFRFRVKAP